MSDWSSGFAYGVSSAAAVGGALYGLVNLWLDRRDRMREVRSRHRRRR